MEQKLLDLHATAVIAEVERQVSIAPDILLGHCVRLRFDLYFVGMVVAPSGAVASTNRALAYVNVLGESGNCDCNGAAVAAGAYRGVCRRHVVSCCSSWVYQTESGSVWTSAGSHRLKSYLFPNGRLGDKEALGTKYKWLSKEQTLLTSLPTISLWITGHLSEVFKPREIKAGHFT
jgi:hypothetical protein